MSANEWLGLVSFFILVYFVLCGVDENRKADARLEVFEAAHPRTEGEK